jgi:hypothetical protein
MDGEGWALIGGYFACGLVVATVVYWLHFARQAPEDGGVVVFMIPLWPLVIGVYVLLGVCMVAATLVTFGRCWRTPSS